MIDGIAICKAELLEQLDLVLEVRLLLWRRDTGIDVGFALHVFVEELVDIFLVVVVVAVRHDMDTDNPCLDVLRERRPRNLQDAKNIFSKYMELTSLYR